jgi:hypothetical protein
MGISKNGGNWHLEAFLCYFTCLNLILNIETENPFHIMTLTLIVFIDIVCEDI